jgi:hypothetical protein
LRDRAFEIRRTAGLQTPARTIAATDELPLG